MMGLFQVAALKWAPTYLELPVLEIRIAEPKGGVLQRSRFSEHRFDGGKSFCKGFILAT
jgi:hypothetical protein